MADGEKPENKMDVIDLPVHVIMEGEREEEQFASIEALDSNLLHFSLSEETLFRNLQCDDDPCYEGKLFVVEKSIDALMDSQANLILDIVHELPNGDGKGEMDAVDDARDEKLADFFDDVDKGEQSELSDVASYQLPLADDQLMGGVVACSGGFLQGSAAMDTEIKSRSVKEDIDEQSSEWKPVRRQFSDESQQEIDIMCSSAKDNNDKDILSGHQGDKLSTVTDNEAIFVNLSFEKTVFVDVHSINEPKIFAQETSFNLNTECIDRTNLSREHFSHETCESFQDSTFVGNKSQTEVCLCIPTVIDAIELQLQEGESHLHEICYVPLKHGSKEMPHDRPVDMSKDEESISLYEESWPEQISQDWSIEEMPAILECEEFVSSTNQDMHDDCEFQSRFDLKGNNDKIIVGEVQMCEQSSTSSFVHDLSVETQGKEIYFWEQTELRDVHVDKHMLRFDDVSVSSDVSHQDMSTVPDVKQDTVMAHCAGVTCLTSADDQIAFTVCEDSGKNDMVLDKFVTKQQAVKSDSDVTFTSASDEAYSFVDKTMDETINAPIYDDGNALLVRKTPSRDLIENKPMSDQWVVESCSNDWVILALDDVPTVVNETIQDQTDVVTCIVMSVGEIVLPVCTTPSEDLIENKLKSERQVPDLVSDDGVISVFDKPHHVFDETAQEKIDMDADMPISDGEGIIPVCKTLSKDLIENKLTSERQVLDLISDNGVISVFDKPHYVVDETAQEKFYMDADMPTSDGEGIIPVCKASSKDLIENKLSSERQVLDLISDDGVISVCDKPHHVVDETAQEKNYMDADMPISDGEGIVPVCKTLSKDLIENKLTSERQLPDLVSDDGVISVFDRPHHVVDETAQEKIDMDADMPISDGEGIVPVCKTLSKDLIENKLTSERQVADLVSDDSFISVFDKPHHVVNETAQKKIDMDADMPISDGEGIIPVCKTSSKDLIENKLTSERQVLDLFSVDGVISVFDKPHHVVNETAQKKIDMDADMPISSDEGIIPVCKTSSKDLIENKLTSERQVLDLISDDGVISVFDKPHHVVNETAQEKIDMDADMPISDGEGIIPVCKTSSKDLIENKLSSERQLPDLVSDDGVISVFDKAHHVVDETAQEKIDVDADMPISDGEGIMPVCKTLSNDLIENKLTSERQVADLVSDDGVISVFDKPHHIVDETAQGKIYMDADMPISDGEGIIPVCKTLSKDLIENKLTSERQVLDLISDDGVISVFDKPHHVVDETAQEKIDMDVDMPISYGEGIIPVCETSSNDVIENKLTSERQVPDLLSDDGVTAELDEATEEKIDVEIDVRMLDDRNILPVCRKPSIDLMKDQIMSEQQAIGLVSDDGVNSAMDEACSLVDEVMQAAINVETYMPISDDDNASPDCKIPSKDLTEDKFMQMQHVLRLVSDDAVSSSLEEAHYLVVEESQQAINVHAYVPMSDDENAFLVCKTPSRDLLDDKLISDQQAIRSLSDDGVLPALDEAHFVVDEEIQDKMNLDTTMPILDYENASLVCKIPSKDLIDDKTISEQQILQFVSDDGVASTLDEANSLVDDEMQKVINVEANVSLSDDDNASPVCKVPSRDLIVDKRLSAQEELKLVSDYGVISTIDEAHTPVDEETQKTIFAGAYVQLSEDISASIICKAPSTTVVENKPISEQQVLCLVSDGVVAFMLEEAHSLVDEIAQEPINVEAYLPMPDNDNTLLVCEAPSRDLIDNKLMSDQQDITLVCDDGVTSTLNEVNSLIDDEMQKAINFKAYVPTSDDDNALHVSKVQSRDLIEDKLLSEQVELRFVPGDGFISTLNEAHTVVDEGMLETMYAEAYVQLSDDKNTSTICKTPSTNVVENKHISEQQFLHLASHSGVTAVLEETHFLVDEPARETINVETFVPISDDKNALLVCKTPSRDLMSDKDVSGQHIMKLVSDDGVKSTLEEEYLLGDEATLKKIDVEADMPLLDDESILSISHRLSKDLIGNKHTSEQQALRLVSGDDVAYALGQIPCLVGGATVETIDVEAYVPLLDGNCDILMPMTPCEDPMEKYLVSDQQEENLVSENYSVMHTVGESHPLFGESTQEGNIIEVYAPISDDDSLLDVCKTPSFNLFEGKVVSDEHGSTLVSQHLGVICILDEVLPLVDEAAQEGIGAFIPVVSHTSSRHVIDNKSVLKQQTMTSVCDDLNVGLTSAEACSTVSDEAVQEAMDAGMDVPPTGGRHTFHDCMMPGEKDLDVDQCGLDKQVVVLEADVGDDVGDEVMFDQVYCREDEARKEFQPVAPLAKKFDSVDTTPSPQSPTNKPCANDDGEAELAIGRTTVPGKGVASPDLRDTVIEDVCYREVQKVDGIEAESLHLQDDVYSGMMPAASECDETIYESNEIQYDKFMDYSPLDTSTFSESEQKPYKLLEVFSANLPEVLSENLPKDLTHDNRVCSKSDIHRQSSCKEGSEYVNCSLKDLHVEKYGMDGGMESYLSEDQVLLHKCEIYTDHVNLDDERYNLQVDVDTLNVGPKQEVRDTPNLEMQVRSVSSADVLQTDNNVNDSEKVELVNSNDGLLTVYSENEIGQIDFSELKSDQYADENKAVRESYSEQVRFGKQDGLQDSVIDADKCFRTERDESSVKVYDTQCDVAQKMSQDPIHAVYDAVTTHEKQTDQDALCVSFLEESHCLADQEGFMDLSVEGRVLVTPSSVEDLSVSAIGVQTGMSIEVLWTDNQVQTGSSMECIPCYDTSYDSILSREIEMGDKPVGN